MIADLNFTATFILPFVSVTVDYVSETYLHNQSPIHIVEATFDSTYVTKGGLKIDFVLNQN